MKVKKGHADEMKVEKEYAEEMKVEKTAKEMKVGKEHPKEMRVDKGYVEEMKEPLEVELLKTEVLKEHEEINQEVVRRRRPIVG